MTAACTDQQAVAAAELALLLLIGEAQAGAALEQGHPFVLGLVVPEARRAGGLAGVNALQPPTFAAGQQAGVLRARRRAGQAEQMASGAQVCGIGIAGR